MAGPWSGHGRLQTTKLAGSARRFRPGLCVRQVMVQPSPCAQVRCGECNGPDDAAWPARPLWCCCRRWRRGQVHCLYCVEAAQDFADCPRRCDYPGQPSSGFRCKAIYPLSPSGRAPIWRQGLVHPMARQGHDVSTFAQLPTYRRHANAKSPASAGLVIAGQWEATEEIGIRASVRGAARRGWMTVCSTAPPPARCCTPKNRLSIRWNAHMLTPPSDSRQFTACAVKGAPISSVRREPASDPPSGPRRGSARDRRCR